MCMKIDFGKFLINLMVPCGGDGSLRLLSSSSSSSSSSIPYCAFPYNASNYSSLVSTKNLMHYNFSCQLMVPRANLNPFQEQNTSTGHPTDITILSHQTKNFCVLKTLCEAFKLSTKNPATILTVIFLSTLVSFFIFAFNYLLIRHLTFNFTKMTNSMHQFESNNPEHFALVSLVILKFLMKLLSFEVIVLAASFIVHTLIATAIIHALSLTFSEKVMSFNDLLSKLSLRGLKGPIITKVSVSFLNLAASLPLVILAVIFYGLHMAECSMVVLISFGTIPAILALVLYLYVAVIGSVSGLISVFEDDCYGIEAISKAVKIINGGRKQQGVSLMLVEFAVTGVTFGIYSLAKDYVNPGSMYTQLGIRLVYRALALSTSVLTLAANMLFYFDCNKKAKESC